MKLTNEKKSGFAPTWKAGDHWRVRYRILAANPAKMRNAPPRYEESEFDYRVEKIDKEAIRVSAQYDSERWEMTYSPDGRLRSILTKYFEPEEPVDDTRPYFDLSYLGGERLVKAWPRFPIEEPFGLDESSLTQRVERTEEGMIVTLVRTGYSGSTSITRTLVMEWKKGRPWWSHVTIDAVNKAKDKTYNVHQVRAEVIQWPPSTP